MPTAIILGVGFLCSLLILLRDVLRKRSLKGGTPEKYFGNPYDYELGTILIFKKLPCLPIVGNLGSLVLFFSVLLYVPALLAAKVDGSWFLPEGDKGFLEEFLLPAGVIIIALVAYIFRTIMDFLPTAVMSIVKYKINPELSEQIKPEAKEHIKKAASFIFQTDGGRSISSLMFDIGLGIFLMISVIALQIAKLFKDPTASTLWADPPHLWGNIAMITVWFILIYFARIIGSYVVRISVALWRLGRILDQEKLLDVEPLHPDGAGGLGEFGKLAWRMDLLLMPLVIFLFYWYFTRGMDPVFYILTIACFILVPFVFLLPLWGVHKAMAQAKREEQDILSKRFNLYAPIMRRWFNNEDGTTKEQGFEAQEAIERIHVQYERVSKIPVWPFNTITLLKVLTYMLAVLLPTIIGTIF